MDTLLQTLGFGAIVLLIIIGLLAGWIASLITGGGRTRYMCLGVIGALALPLVLAALGVTAIAAAGLVAIAIAAAVGAAVLVLLGILLFR